MQAGLGTRTFDLAAPSVPVRVQDFEVMNTGAQIIETYDCVRNPEPDAASPPSGLTATRSSTGLRDASRIALRWSGGAARVDVYRNGAHLAAVDNAGAFNAPVAGTEAVPYTVCNAETDLCSDTVVR